MIDTRPPDAPYQTEGARFLSKRYRAALFDEPGVGKTLQAIRARELAGLGRTLIVCPAGVRKVWPDQWRKWGQTAPRMVRAESIVDVLQWLRGRVEVLILSYEQATMWQERLSSDFFDCLIIDESHYLKNVEAQRTMALFGPKSDGTGGIAAMARHVWMLTGTPIKNDPADLWVPFRVCGATTDTFTGFQQRFFNQRHTTFSTVNKAKKGAAGELKAMMDSIAKLRTLDDIGEHLPPLRLDELPIDGDDTEIVAFLKQYPGLSDAILKSLQEGGRISFEDGTHIATLRSLIAEAKAPGYAKLLASELGGGAARLDPITMQPRPLEKIVVMGHHRKALTIIADHLNRAKIKTEMITGATTERADDNTVRSFQEDPNGVRVIVGNIIAAGTGITLTAASHIDMFESSWTATDNAQAIARVYRRGQKRPTVARFVMLDNSFDRAVQKIVIRKIGDASDITQTNTLVKAMIVPSAA